MWRGGRISSEETLSPIERTCNAQPVSVTRRRHFESCLAPRVGETDQTTEVERNVLQAFSWIQSHRVSSPRHVARRHVSPVKIRTISIRKTNPLTKEPGGGTRGRTGYWPVQESAACRFCLTNKKKSQKPSGMRSNRPRCWCGSSSVLLTHPSKVTIMG